MIEHNLVPPFVSPLPPSGRSKRQSKPSVYASCIKNFKEQQQRQDRKHKSSYNVQEETHWENTPNNRTNNGPIKCVLPSGKKLSLSIIIRKKHRKTQKQRNPIAKVSPKESKTIANQNKKSQSEGPDLLQKLLMAAQELNNMEREFPPKVEAEGASLSQNDENKEKKSKRRQFSGENEKSLRLWERGRLLNDKCENILNNMIYL